MKIRNLLFDLGGVIVDLDRDRCVEAFRQLGFPQAGDLLDPYKQAGMFLKLEEGSITPEHLYQNIREHGGPHLTQEMIDGALNQFLVDIPQYKLDMLLALRRKFKVYMLSNTNAIMFPYIVNRWFSGRGRTIGDYFDRCFLSYEMGVVKPSPEIFDMIIAAGIDPAETLFLDDGLANVEQAARQGFHTLHVKPGEDYRPALEALQPF